ncbi:MAG: glycosyltransferase [Kiritimatiellae bacterium]|nr:glycosyltransferase [Kiritimatiellia bacterium]
MAYRRREGPTGGAGGVLYVQEALLGRELDGLALDYEYQPDRLEKGRGAARLQQWAWRWLNLGHAYFDHFVWARRVIRRLGGRRTFFVAHEPWSAFVLALMRQRYVLVYHQQGALAAEKDSFRQALSRRERGWEHAIECLAFRRAEHVYFPSRGAEEAFLATTKWLKAGSFRHGGILHNTILEDDARPGEADAKALARIPSDRTVFVSIGAYSEAKGLDRVPEFLARFAGVSARPFAWVVVGSGRGRESLEQEVRARGLDGSVMIFDGASHAFVLKLLEKADVYIMLHRRSIFDFATLEAMRAGCALVLSDEGGNREVNVRENVLLVRGGEAESAARRLASADLRDLGEQNRRVFAGHFSPAEFRKRYIAMLCRHAGMVPPAGEMPRPTPEP